jgi:hypothetical protein
MNPFLEQDDTWQDFHDNFITCTQEALSGQVGPHYLVKIEVRLYVHELPAGERRFFGMTDVGVTGSAGAGLATRLQREGPGTAGVAGTRCRASRLPPDSRSAQSSPGYGT